MKEESIINSTRFYSHVYSLSLLLMRTLVGTWNLPKGHFSPHESILLDKAINYILLHNESDINLHNNKEWSSRTVLIIYKDCWFHASCRDPFDDYTGVFWQKLIFSILCKCKKREWKYRYVLVTPFKRIIAIMAISCS